MSHRLQITLEDEQYETLERESRRTGASMAELVRQAVSARFGLTDDDRADQFRAALTAAAGLWSDRDVDGTEYQARRRAEVVERFGAGPGSRRSA